MKKLRFLISLTTDDNDYQIEQAQSAEQTARNMGAELQILYANNDAITQSTQILKAVQAAEVLRPDAIVFEPVGGTALPQVARAAVSAGIGWAVLNREASYVPELRKLLPESVGPFSTAKPATFPSSASFHPLRFSLLLPTTSRSAAFRAANLLRCFLKAAAFFIFRDPRRIPRPRNAPSACRRPNPPIST